MYEEEEPENNTTKIIIPKYRIIHSDLEVEKKDPNVTENGVCAVVDRPDKFEKTIKKDLVEKILEHASQSLDNNSLDKEIATKLKRKLDEDPDLNHPSVTPNEKKMEEHGVWQVIVGKSYVASVTFDAKYLIYFQFLDLGKYFLCFRS